LVRAALTTLPRVTIAIAVLTPALGCHRSKTYESDVTITRSAVVRRDAMGRPQTLDLEVSYVRCPGTQIEVLRGGPEFAACVGIHKVGETVPVVVQHVWDDRGVWRNEVVEVAGCKRDREPDDEGSFTMVRECEDWTVNGARVGLWCDYGPNENLVKKCPWFARR
jgi:hypothetical protein